MLEFTLFDIKIQIKFLFIAIVTIFLLTDKTGLISISLLSCLLHELGHIISFHLVKVKPRLLSFDITGIRLEQPNKQLPFLIELITLISGSLTNYIIALICQIISPVELLNIILINIMIGTFNLLPLRTFDGGKILFVILSSFFTDIVSYKISIAFDRGTSVLLICLVLLSIYAYEFNLSYIIISLLLIFSISIPCNFRDKLINCYHIKKNK